MIHLWMCCYSLILYDFAWQLQAPSWGWAEWKVTAIAHHHHWNFPVCCRLNNFGGTEYFLGLEVYVQHPGLCMTCPRSCFPDQYHYWGVMTSLRSWTQVGFNLFETFTGELLDNCRAVPVLQSCKTVFLAQTWCQKQFQAKRRPSGYCVNANHRVNHSVWNMMQHAWHFGHGKNLQVFYLKMRGDYYRTKPTLIQHALADRDIFCGPKLGSAENTGILRPRLPCRIYWWITKRWGWI